MATRESVVNMDPNPLDYRALVEESLAGIYLVQGERFLYVNPTMAGFFGYTPEEILRERGVADLVAPVDRGRVRENLRKRLEGEVETLHYTFRAQRRDGSIFVAEVRGRRTEASGVPAVIGTMLDVTERVQERERLTFLARAAELLDSSLHYETTLESLASLMIPSLADFCVIAIVEGDRVRRLVSAHGELERDELPMEAVSGGGRAGGSVAEQVLRSGEGVLASRVQPQEAARLREDLPGPSVVREAGIGSLMAVPLVARGQTIGAMTLLAAEPGRRYSEGDFEFAREVARSAALAVDNARLYREAEEAIRRRQEVLAVVSHDLRNPLNVITMTTSLLIEQERRRSGPLEMIYDAAQLMDRLIRDLLDVSAIEAGGFSVEPAPLPVGPLIQRCFSLLANLAQHRSVRLVNLVPPEGGPHAMIDENRFIQALCNLIGNALKFTPPGGRVCVEAGNSDGMVLISVHDTGPGIPASELDHIFDRFWRAEPADGGGTGLGLSIVRGIAEAHGGGVYVESAPGRGTSFHLTLPAAA